MTSPFAPSLIEDVIGAVCWHMGWDFNQFAALPNAEREFWMKWELRRRTRLNDTLRESTQGDKVYAETVTAQLILYLLRNG